MISFLIGLLYGIFIVGCHPDRQKIGVFTNLHNYNYEKPATAVVLGTLIISFFSPESTINYMFSLAGMSIGVVGADKKIPKKLNLR